MWSETEQHLGEVAGDVLGADANAGPWGRDRVYMRALTIAGGTTQVNKNILATGSSASPASNPPHRFGVTLVPRMAALSRRQNGRWG